MAGSYWSSQHCKAVAEVNSALRARELKVPGLQVKGSVVRQINGSSWFVAVYPSLMHAYCFFALSFVVAFSCVRHACPSAYLRMIAAKS